MVYVFGASTFYDKNCFCLSLVAQNNKGNRRSNVVKEVEKLKKNREERRQRQAELKEEKEALMNLDPGNPNWEFLAMIRFVI